MLDRGQAMRFDLMMTRSIFLFVLSLLVATAQAQDPAAHGQALVAEFCGGCHAVGVKGKSKHPDAPPFRTLGRTVDLDEFPRVLERGISSGHPDMPEFKFSHDDALAVRAYLRLIQQ
ncbi:MAG TPA: c-type cytochrome [Pseudolabrys sp.]|nr:c-type cytochrome [Pseudolabrys sp.]